MLHISYLTFFIATLAILNPISSIAQMLSLTDNTTTKKEMKRIALIASISVAIILILSLWFGTDLLRSFDVSIGGFTTGGGLIVILVGLKMVEIHPQPATKATTAIKKGSIAIVPLAIPLTAGPGAIATVILHGYHLHTLQERLILSFYCCALAFIVWICLYFAAFFAKILGDSGISIFSRLMGIITAAIGVQMLSAGFTLLFPALSKL